MGSEVTYGIGGQVPHDMYTAGASNSSQRKFAWEDVGLGDGFKDAQGIVGQEGGGRVTKYVYHYMDEEGRPLDRRVYQVRESVRGGGRARESPRARERGHMWVCVLRECVRERESE